MVMNVRAIVTKAALLSIGAVLTSIVLTVSVARAPQTASATMHEQPRRLAAQVALVTQIHAEAPRLPAAPALPSDTATPTLLPVVDQPVIHDDHKQLADTVLRRLPVLCLKNLKNFYVLYEGATQRGLGGKSSIIIDGNVGRDEFIALLVHECGHVIHGNLLGHPSSGRSNFRDGNDVFARDSSAAAFFAISWSDAKKRNSHAKKEDFVTGYASHDAFEDFAETFTTYVLERPSMEARAIESPAINAKLQWMEQQLPLAGGTFGIPLYSWRGSIPWDATKLPFVWRPLAMK